MREDLKSGIPKLDKLVEDFENGKINFIDLTSSLWNYGFKAGEEFAIMKYFKEQK